ncbi:Syntaxin [Arachis hypogaea]|nr:Syntaxin [Arachis hypogaea]
MSTSLLNPNRSYIPLSTDDPGSSSKDLNLVTVGLPPAWVDVSEEISANVQRARTKMAELAKAHAKALMPSFGDEKRLQRLPAGGPSEDSNVRKNVQRSLATDLQNLSVELRKKQSTYLRRLRQQKEGQDGVDLEINMNGSKSTYEDDDLDNMIFNEHQMAKLKKTEAFTVEREKEIQQLAQIMKDLSVLVIDQAERNQKKGGMLVLREDQGVSKYLTHVFSVLDEEIRK